MAPTCPSSDLSTLVIVAEASIGLWIWSVWSWRLRRESPFRPPGAKNLLQEFQSYGYPRWVLKMVGAIKTSFASMLILSIIYPVKLVTLVGASGMCFLMSVAVLSHAKVKDPLTKYVAALVMLILSIYVLYALSVGCIIEADAPLPVYLPDHLPQSCFGILVAAACFGMWLRSFLNSDYNLDTYESLDGGLLKA
mmetsp:Transcript_20683/g.33413  ORF Transcript_20683/g.33413 Transcript_20683/m.33413 type:complete len:194 (-) Transcript_20683:238-819(-)|eukprot:CAMPEP_0169125714 /NCGR_PEP_ID=MMETSP1015-20121227/35042_1 /TAXON_ID=342587 /ORGANISM="Karlodinium micrum, Strain CCMP2283" /LENGTH=193 /DNA_ID=CAMNT_0009189289 /DNA_START=41 /DNA_END=622 /DNA_ORIENTATION=+